jgi:hypothetical protein
MNQKWRGAQPDPEKLRAAALPMYWALKSVLQVLPSGHFTETRKRIRAVLAMAAAVRP